MFVFVEGEKQKNLEKNKQQTLPSYDAYGGSEELGRRVPFHHSSCPYVIIVMRNFHIVRATLKAGMTERRNGRITERRKITPNPKRRNRGITERRKIPLNPKRRNDGKSPEILKDGIMENHPKS